VSQVILAQGADFYRILLESEIYLPGSSDTLDEGCHSLPPGTRFSVAVWKKKDGTEAIPFFASLQALQFWSKEPTRYVAMPARAFFEMTRGAIVVINPGSEYGKEFLPHEIDALLETGLNCTTTVEEVSEHTKVLLGQPADYPATMVGALSKLLAKHRGVKGAYLCLMDTPSSGGKPALVVALEGDGDLVPIIQEAGTVAAVTAPAGQPVNFVEISRGETGIAEYFFASVRPFYERDQNVVPRGGRRPRLGLRFVIAAFMLGVFHRALMPQVPGFIAWPVIFCILMILVWFISGGKRPLPPEGT
jgi:hypothetical protein